MFGCGVSGVSDAFLLGDEWCLSMYRVAIAIVALRVRSRRLDWI